MKAYVAECDCGALSERRSTRARAMRALKRHICRPAPIDPSQRIKCQHCTRWFLLLVDGMLCIRCDSLLYPEVAA